MKKMMIAATILAIAGASHQTAKAGDREWATAGKILTGVVAGAVIASALDCTPVHASVSYTYGAPVYSYCPPPRAVIAPAPVVCASLPVVVYRAPVYVAPRPVVRVTYDLHRDHRHGWNRHHCR